MKRFTFVLAVLPLLVTGCVTRTVRYQQEQLCADLRTLTTAIAVVRSVSARSTSTVATLKQSEERVSEAFTRLKLSVQREQAEAKELADMKEVKELEEAYKKLDKSIKDLPDQFTMAQAVTFIGDNMTVMESALVKTKTGLRCPSTLSDYVGPESSRPWRR